MLRIHSFLQQIKNVKNYLSRILLKKHTKAAVAIAYFTAATVLILNFGCFGIITSDPVYVKAEINNNSINTIDETQMQMVKKFSIDLTTGNRLIIFPLGQTLVSNQVIKKSDEAARSAAVNLELKNEAGINSGTATIPAYQNQKIESGAITRLNAEIEAANHIKQSLGTNTASTKTELVSTKQQSAKTELVSTKQQSAKTETVSTKQQSAKTELVSTKQQSAKTETVSAKQQNAKTETVSTKQQDSKKETVDKEQEVLSTKTNLVKAYNASMVRDLSESELEILQRIVEAEATDEDIYGKILVANVVLNRVESSDFPDTVKGVVFQKSKTTYQFSPIKDKRYYSVKITKSTREAVKRALQGEDYSKGALYFFARRLTSSKNASWFDRSLKFVVKHGCHEFFANK